MTANEIAIVSGKLACPDGRQATPDMCRFCMHSRYFVVNGKQEPSPALACCLRERVTKIPDIAKATAVGCGAKPNTGYANIGNIIS